MHIRKSQRPSGNGNPMQRKLLRLVSVLCVIAGTTGALAQRSPVTGTGTFSKFDGVDEIVESCNQQVSAWTTIASMVRTFSISGTTPAKVLVTFQGSLSISGQSFDTGFIRLLIDGAQQRPGVIPAIGVAPGGALNSGTHGFTWQSTTLTAGAHTASIQYRTDLGSSLCADARSLIIMHK